MPSRFLPARLGTACLPVYAGIKVPIGQMLLGITRNKAAYRWWDHIQPPAPPVALAMVGPGLPLLTYHLPDRLGLTALLIQRDSSETAQRHGVAFNPVPIGGRGTGCRGVCPFTAPAQALKAISQTQV